MEVSLPLIAGHLKAFGRLRVWQLIHSVVWACKADELIICPDYLYRDNAPNCDSFCSKSSKLQALRSKGLPVKAGMLFFRVYSCCGLFREHFAETLTVVSPKFLDVDACYTFGRMATAATGHQTERVFDKFQIAERHSAAWDITIVLTNHQSSYVSKSYPRMKCNFELALKESRARNILGTCLE